MLEAVPSLETDVGGEVDRPAYRVGLWRPLGHGSDEDSPGWAVETWRLTGADVEDVLAWAEARKPDRGIFTVAVEAAHHGGSGTIDLIWLRGEEPIRTGPPRRAD